MDWRPQIRSPNPITTASTASIDALTTTVTSLSSTVDDSAAAIVDIQRRMQVVVAQRATNPGAAVDVPWFGALTSVNLTVGTYIVEGILEVTLGASNTTATKMNIEFDLLSGTVSAFKAYGLFHVSGSKGSELTRMSATSTAYSLNTTAANYASKSLTVSVYGVCVVTAAAVLKPLFSWTINTGGSAGSIVVEPGTHFKMTAVIDNGTFWQ